MSNRDLPESSPPTPEEEEAWRELEQRQSHNYKTPPQNQITTQKKENNENQRQT